jgi:hypothetical protein
MELLLGFILGIVASVIASFLFSWFTVVVPQDRQRKFVSLLRNPRLSLRVLRDTEERKVRDRIHSRRGVKKIPPRISRAGRMIVFA